MTTRSEVRDYRTASLANAPRQERSRALTTRILDSALRVLRRPDASFTIRAVAHEAGVSVGGICGRFADRDELLCAAHSHVIEGLENRVRANLVEQYGSLQEMLQGFIHAVATTCREDGLAMAKIQAEPFADRALARAAVGMDTMQDILGEAISRHRGEITRPDFAFAVHIVTQIVVGTITREVMIHQRDTSDRNWTLLCNELEIATAAYLTSSAKP